MPRCRDSAVHYSNCVCTRRGALASSSCARLNMEKIPAVLDPFFFHEEHYAPVWESRVLVGKDRQMGWLFYFITGTFFVDTHDRNMKWLTFLGFIYIHQLIDV